MLIFQSVTATLNQEKKKDVFLKASENWIFCCRFDKVHFYKYKKNILVLKKNDNLFFLCLFTFLLQSYNNNQVSVICNRLAFILLPRRWEMILRIELLFLAILIFWNFLCLHSSFYFLTCIFNSFWLPFIVFNDSHSKKKIEKIIFYENIKKLIVVFHLLCVMYF